MSDTKIIKSVLLEVTRQFRRSGKAVGPLDTEVETLTVEGFHVPPAEVEVRKSVTLNMGNYESAQISVGIRVPCYREEVQEAYGYAIEFVDAKVIEQQTSVKEWATKRGVTYF